ncbi:hypothetical protein F511_38099 [Dorcoceras hygrometricum]|uniref:Uncharacterized protein n=1 Tax=Dorcoceras hygrometricum TaxID=472368 RepID=A0A2Z7AD23_9LAMI|nr:hypothetical protein F511_38099 [Dorcoceras hygrometricum]
MLKKRNKSCSGAGPFSGSDIFSGIRARQVHNPVGEPNLKFCKDMAPSAPRTRAAAALRMKQIALDNQSRMIRRLRVQLETERRGMKTKKQQARDSHQKCHHKWQARIQAAEDTIQEQHMIIEALVEEKASLLQKIQGL